MPLSDHLDSSVCSLTKHPSMGEGLRRKRKRMEAESSPLSLSRSATQHMRRRQVSVQSREDFKLDLSTRLPSEDVECSTDSQGHAQPLEEHNGSFHSSLESTSWPVSCLDHSTALRCHDLALCLIRLRQRGHSVDESGQSIDNDRILRLFSYAAYILDPSCFRNMREALLKTQATGNTSVSGSGRIPEETAFLRRCQNTYKKSIACARSNEKVEEQNTLVPASLWNDYLVRSPLEVAWGWKTSENVPGISCANYAPSLFSQFFPLLEKGNTKENNKCRGDSARWSREAFSTCLYNMGICELLDVHMDDNRRRAKSERGFTCSFSVQPSMARATVFFEFALSCIKDNYMMSQKDQVRSSTCSSFHNRDLPLVAAIMNNVCHCRFHQSVGNEKFHTEDDCTAQTLSKALNLARAYEPEHGNYVEREALRDELSETLLVNISRNRYHRTTQHRINSKKVQKQSLRDIFQLCQNALQIHSRRIMKNPQRDWDTKIAEDRRLAALHFNIGLVLRDIGVLGGERLGKEENEVAHSLNDSVKNFKVSVTHFQKCVDLLVANAKIETTSKAEHVDLDSSLKVVAVLDLLTIIECEGLGKHDDGVELCHLTLQDEARRVGGQASFFQRNSTLLCQGQKLATPLNRLGHLHFRRKEHDKALQFFLCGLQLESRGGGTALRNVAITLNNIGHSYQNLGDYDKAIDFYKESLTKMGEVRDATGNEDSEQRPLVAGILYNLGVIHYERSFPYEAMQCFELALTLRRSMMSKNTENDTVSNHYKEQGHHHVADILHNIGIIQLNEGMSDEALKTFSESLELRRSVDGGGEGMEYGDMSPLNAAVTLFMAGQIHQQNMEEDLALAMYGDVVRVLLQAGKYHPFLVRALCGASEIFGTRRAVPESLALVQTAHNILTRLSLTFSSSESDDSDQENDMTIAATLFRVLHPVRWFFQAEEGSWNQNTTASAVAASREAEQRRALLLPEHAETATEFLPAPAA